jgi:hypothetical protein
MTVGAALTVDGRLFDLRRWRRADRQLVALSRSR